MRSDRVLDLSFKLICFHLPRSGIGYSIANLVKCEPS